MAILSHTTTSGAIPSSPADRLARVFLLSATGLDLLSRLIGGPGPFRSTADILGGLVIAHLIPAIWLRRPAAIKGILLLALIQLWIFVGLPRSWPFHFLEPLIVYGLILLVVRPLRKRPDWAWLGRMDGLTLGLMAATIFLSAAALIAWQQVLHPDLTDIRDNLLAQAGDHLVLFGLTFAVVNALLEEMVWRGILMEAFLGTGLGTVAAIFLQAVAFGIAHIHGFPRGALGVAMAGVYGLVLGVIRHRTGALAAPVLTHIAADATIFILLVRLFS